MGDKFIPLVFNSAQARGPVASIVPGPNNKIWRMWAEIDGHEVQSIAVGQYFDILVDFEIENIGALSWHATVTAFAGQTPMPTPMAVYADAAVGIIGFPWTDYAHWRDTFKLTKVYPGMLDSIMLDITNSPLVTTIKIWMHDSQLVEPPYPELYLWQ